MGGDTFELRARSKYCARDFVLINHIKIMAYVSH